MYRTTIRVNHIKLYGRNKFEIEMLCLLLLWLAHEFTVISFSTSHPYFSWYILSIEIKMVPSHCCQSNKILKIVMYFGLDGPSSFSILISFIYIYYKGVAGSKALLMAKRKK